MALPTNGRVIIDTSVGELDIELWSKEAPKACRNFLALSMEGYYDGVIFHRVVPGFLVQTGDKTGTGGGGESFYGDPFEDEIHPRLRFPHRGIVAMANNGTKNSNDSQFFITLDRADELHGKHTVFGRCVGDTVYNVMKIGEMELDGNERPVYPPKIRNVRIMDNPFDDIIPRITAAERRAQQRAREQGQREREEEMRRKGAKKNTKLLSFGADEGDGDGEEDEPVFKKKAIYRPDLMQDSAQSSSSVPLPDFVTQPEVSSARNAANGDSAPVGVPKTSKKGKNRDDENDITKIRERHAAEQKSSMTARQSQINSLETQIRKMSKRTGGDDSDDEPDRKKPKKSFLEEELAKYTTNKSKGGKKGKRRDEGDVLAALTSFRGKLQDAPAEDVEMGSLAAVSTDDGPAATSEGDAAPIQGEAEEEEPLEVDDDVGFLSHRLHFAKDDGEETVKAERDYEVIDPRVRGARAKEEERERKKREKESGRRGGGRTARDRGGTHAGGRTKW